MQLLISHLLKIVIWIIPFVAKWIYPLKQFENDLDFVIETGSSPTVDFSEDCPGIRLNIKINNKSEYLDAVFDRAIFSVQLNKQGHYNVIRSAYLLRKEVILRKRDLFIYIDHLFSGTELKTARRAIGGESSCEVIIKMDYYMESKLYNVWKHTERRALAEVINNRPVSLMA